ncbi:TPA: TIGR03756 family integrating conjugative element protein [Shewanella algae]|uniref:TIGR03756 family integrating conjugative element protein n=1 Tax=Shewanella TaxID=22 RepID=UPI00142F4C93|nr:MULTISPECIES: TIGR03756 family integrating conjugative element protein [Shewanella]NJI86943.1 TIGR03756 family integrating conjugative element protein [Shewanella sp. Iso12]HDS1208437.1 TIGR03756 family integrating conjugative element protein [Shewanella algae]
MNKFVLLIWPLLITICQNAGATEKLDSLSIMESSLSLQCVDWKPIGVCFWLKCRPFPPSCSVETSLKVRHYTPDAVVQVYSNPGDVPWPEMSFLSESLSLKQTATTPANGREKSESGKSQSAKVITRHVDVIGSPSLIPVSEMIGSMEYGCKSGATPYMPYYVSMLDYFSWKFPYGDLLNPASFVPGMREVGEREDGENETFLFKGKFGNVYPRIGALVQNDSYKASAVFAQRAADIVTDKSALHVYQFLGEKNGKPGWWPPKQIKEHTSLHGKWRMLYPKMESECHIFGESSTRSDKGVFDGYQHRRSPDLLAGFELWRPYECCEKKGQIFLYSVDSGTNK